MKFKKTRSFAKTIFRLTSLAYLSLGIGIAKTTIENDRRAEISSISKQNHSIFQFPLTRENIEIPFSQFLRLYSDCNQKIYNSRNFEYAKSQEEITEGVRKRKNLEEIWTRYFNEQVNMGYTNMNFIDTTTEWYNPVGENSWFNNGFNDSRVRNNRWRERHEAIDIFARKNTPVYSILAGVVIAAGDNWKGSWNRKRGLQHESGGLGELSGNALIIFHPQTKSYSFYAHGGEGLNVKIGDVVSQGEEIMRVGKTGNSLSPYVRSHLHLAYKSPGKECGVEDVLVAQNPYWNLRETRRVDLARRNERNITGTN